MVVKAFCCHGNIDCSRTSIDVRAEVFASIRSERGERRDSLTFSVFLCTAPWGPRDERGGRGQRGG